MARASRRREFGCITEKERGRRYEVRWYESTDPGYRRRSKTIRGTRAEAGRFLAAKQLESSNDRRSTPTVQEICDLYYLPTITRQVEEGKKKAGTIGVYKRVLLGHILPKWGRVQVDCINPGKFQEWLLTLTGNDAKLVLVVMRTLFDIAVRYEYIDVNKLRRRYEMPVRKVYEKTKRVYSLAEADAMLERLHGDPIEPPYILSCFGSARVGEACAVKCREVGSIEAGGMVLTTVPIVRRMPQQGTRPFPDGDLKNPQSKRMLIIPDPYGERLRAIASERAAFGYEWLCCSPDGIPLCQSKLNHRFKIAAGADRIPFSNLRSSWRTFAEVEWGLDQKLLELLMGHIIPGVTGKHYFKPTLEDLVAMFVKSYSPST